MAVVLISFRNAKTIIAGGFIFDDLVMACFMKADDIDKYRLKKAFPEHFDNWKMAELEFQANPPEPVT